MVWKALADPTRRAVLDALRNGPRTTGDLCGQFGDRLCRTAVMKHLAILEEARLLIVKREGRHRWNHLNAVPIQRICERWVGRHTQKLASSMLRLKEQVEANEGKARG